MNTFNWKMVVAAVLLMFLSTACSKKLMPPEIESSIGGVESSDFTASKEEDDFGGSGGPGDSEFFSEEPVLESSNFSSGNDGAPGNDDAPSNDDAPGNDDAPSLADISNGSSGSFNGNPFDGGDSGSQEARLGGDSGSQEARLGGDSGSQENRIKSFHVTAELKDIHFNFDQYDLDSNSKKVLEENASFLKSNPDLRVEIQGHCDERGTNNYNIALGERRAHSTKKYLVTQGVASSRVNIISYGEEKPFCSNSNENCWFQNRRAHFMVAK